MVLKVLITRDYQGLRWAFSSGGAVIGCVCHLKPSNQTKQATAGVWRRSPQKICSKSEIVLNYL